MNRQEQIKFLETLHGSIHQHHATNLCKSEYLFEHSKTILTMLSQLRKDEEDENYLRECSERANGKIKIALYGLLYNVSGAFKTIEACNAFLESPEGVTSGMIGIVDGIVYTANKIEAGEVMKK